MNFPSCQDISDYGKVLDPEPDPGEPKPGLEPKLLFPVAPVEPVAPLLGWPVTAFWPKLLADWEPMPPPPVGTPLA